MATNDFPTVFRALTGNSPFPWQQELFRLFVAHQFPASCNLPTGLGKTSVIAIWLVALGTAPRNVPRRLIYVVNRRTVVDQATREAEKIRKKLTTERSEALKELAMAMKKLCATDPESPLAISTLRGQFADNAEWRADPSRPAIIVGTVDMIGSRLLFNGYGCGFKTRPLHAGFLGQDALLVHDEAHLEPAFQNLLTAIKKEQERCREFRKFHVMELTATSRGEQDEFGITDKDRDEPIVQRRILAKKGLVLHPVEEEKSTADKVAELALEHKASDQAILVFLRKLEDVERVWETILKAKLPVERLTGTLRGFERDRLATENKIFARFLPHSDRQTVAAPGTVYLVCTSAGEVGVNISADHLVCDLTPFDSMAQRFGRVNRFGEGDARIDVVHTMRFEDEDKYENRREKTLELLKRLKGSASPKSLSDVPASDHQAAFTPEPEILRTSDILFDAWALTTIRKPLPGRPGVADWLHGKSERELPETRVAWREEVELLTPTFRENEDFSALGQFAEDLLEGYPLKPHELLRDRTDRVFNHLKKLGTPRETAVWLIAEDDSVQVGRLAELIDDGKDELNWKTVLLPPSAGGMRIVNGTATGFLDGGQEYNPEFRYEYDVADRWEDEAGNQRRKRCWDGERPRGMQLVRTIPLTADGEETGESEDTGPRLWRWYVRPRSAEDESREWSSLTEQPLALHLTDTERFAGRIVTALDIEDPVRSVVMLAARHHDRGKARRLWQIAIHNTKFPELVLAKSGNTRPPENLSHYRHEFGSLLDVRKDLEFQKLPTDRQDLFLHLIAAHHGRGRPHFPTDEAFDPENPEAVAEELAREVPRRFARLQRKFGRWGLAYLESLIRAADMLASAPPKGNSK